MGKIYKICTRKVPQECVLCSLLSYSDNTPIMMIVYHHARKEMPHIDVCLWKQSHRML